MPGDGARDASVAGCSCASGCSGRFRRLDVRSHGSHFFFFFFGALTAAAALAAASPWIRSSECACTRTAAGEVSGVEKAVAGPAGRRAE